MAGDRGCSFFEVCAQTLQHTDQIDQIDQHFWEKTLCSVKALVRSQAQLPPAQGEVARHGPVQAG